MSSSGRSRNIEEARKTLEDPVSFAQVILGRNIWGKQKQIARSVAANLRTVVKACHASGKTYIAAAIVLWWITYHREAIAVTTAPTWNQVRRLMWGEIQRLAYHAKISYPEPSATSLRLGPGRYAIGLSSNEGGRVQGFHGENVLIVLDEAPGILPEIYEAIDTIRAGGNVRVLALGNPVISSGPFHDAFSSQRAGWNPITISAFDTPNFEGVTLERLLTMSEAELDHNPRPYLITPRWVREKYYEWGPDHALWQSRVLGNFPVESDSALLSLTWLELAKLRVIDGDGEMWAGLDVAGPGEDETALCIRCDSRIVLLQAWAGSDPRGEILAALLPFKSRLKSVNVDTVGIGYYLAQYLRDHGFPITEINVGQAAREPEKYANRKAELYWNFRLRAKAGDLGGLTDDKAIAQLSSIQYSHNSHGQVVIESKENARKRGVKSPDRAEAVILAFAEPHQIMGWVEYLKDEHQRLVERSPVATSVAVCPYCKSTAVVPIGAGWKCNQCGWQEGGAPPLRSSPSRSEILQAANTLGILPASRRTPNRF